MGHGLGLTDEMRYLLIVSLFGFSGVILAWAMNIVFVYLANEIVVSLGAVGRLIPGFADHLVTLVSGSLWGFFLFLGVCQARGKRQKTYTSHFTLCSLSLGFALLGASALIELLAMALPGLVDVVGHILHGALLGCLYGAFLAQILRLDVWHMFVPLLSVGGAVGALAVTVLQDVPLSSQSTVELYISQYAFTSQGFVLGLFAGYAFFLCDMHMGILRHARWMPED